METKNKEIVILGAGPAGLSAAFTLLKQGIKPLIIEKGKLPGGLMRNFLKGEYQVDIGRKELYTRLREVNDLWNELLGDEYKPYDYHVGMLYKGRILERTSAYKGPLRGMTLGTTLSCALDYVASRISLGSPKNYQDHMYKLRGKKFNQIFSQGYYERFTGRKWKNMPVPVLQATGRKDITFVGSVSKFVSDKNDEKSSQEQWKHPNKGAGQITDRLEEEILKMGGEIWYNTNVQNVDIANNQITSIVVENETGKINIIPSNVVSSIPLEFASQLFFNQTIPSSASKTSLNRGTILVYLFINEAPRFAHTWLNVSDPGLKICRIVNFAKFGGSMVPKGKTCLCVEFFLFSDDSLFDFEKEDLKNLVVKECQTAKLFNSNLIEDFEVFKFKNANAAVSWMDYLNEPYKVELYERLKSIRNLYNVNRAGTDRATHAGICAARAIINNDKEHFEKVTDASKKEPWNE
ncbi:MAG: NAD(P)-binding protein [Bacteroidetes bacterium]|nr:NAD(P)-binding protein [Bacteroidota bacterium]